MEPEYFSKRQTAQRLNVTRATVQNLIDRGELRAVKLGGQWRIPASEFDRLAAEAEASRGRSSGKDGE